MQPIYAQDGTTITGYSYSNGYAIWTYNTGMQLQGITLDPTAISSGALSPLVDANSVTTGYAGVDAFGIAWNFGVDTTGAVTSYSQTYSGAGYSYTYNYDSLGVFTGYSHFDGTTITTYDANRNVIGTVTVTVNMTPILDGSNNTIGYSVTDEWGTTTKYALDQTTITGYSYTYTNSWDNSVSVSNYDANGNYIGSETKDSTGKLLYSNSYSYDANGNFTGYTYFDGLTTTVYDANWKVVSSTANVANLTADGTGGYYSTDAWGTTTTYDGSGAVTGYRYSYTDTWNHTTSISTYDKNWNFLSSETKDGSGNVIYSSSYSYDANGNFTGYTYFDGVTTTVYNANWQVISSTANTANMDELRDPVTNNLIGYSHTDAYGTTTTYDTTGVLTGYSYRYTNWDGSVTVSSYDANWNYLSGETRDAQGSLLYSYTYSYQNGMFNGYTYFDGVTTTVYDANWQVVSSTANIANMDPILDGSGVTIGYSRTDAYGTTTNYDTLGAVTGYSYRYANWDGSVSVSSYDANWNYLSGETRDAQGNLLYSYTYSYVNGVFDGYTYFDGVTTTVYNANWQVVSTTANTTNMNPILDGTGATVGYSYTDQWGNTTTYDLTGAKTGSLYSYTNWDNSTTVTTYDKNGNYIGSETRDSTGKVLYSNSYSYDANGTFTGYTYFDGVTTTVYDANWQVVSSTANVANLTPDGAGGYTFTDAWGTTTTYDATGQVTGYSYRYTNWDGSVSITAYDKNWTYLGSETQDSTGKVLYSSSYSYDANGNFAGYTYYDGVTTTVYDANWQVVSVTASTANMTPLDANGNVLVDANHDGLDDTTNVAVAGYSYTDQWGTTTTYDLAGLITGYSYRTVDSANNTTSVTTYDKNWTWLSSVTTSNTTGNEVYRSEYHYDANGIFIGYTYFDGITTTVYDANWQVISTTTSTANMIPVYDANNQLTGYSFSDAWGTTTYYDTNNVKTGSVNTYVDTWSNTTTVTTYGANGNYLGSETKDSTGKVLYSNSYSYDANGNFTGYTSFDGVTTTVYNSSWQVVSSTTNIANLTEVRDASNGLTGYSYTDAWGTTTYYDTTGVKTGSVYSYTNWDGTKSLSHYDANGGYLGWSNVDAQGNVLSSSMYNYDQQGGYTGYTYFDGITTTVYDANGAYVSSTIDFTKLTQVFAADGTTLTGYSKTDASGTTTYYDTNGVKTGSVYSYTNWDGSKSNSHYDANGSYIGSSYTDAQGNVLSSTMYSYDQQGLYTGYTYFDGITTTVYDANGAYVSSTIDFTKLTQVFAADGTTLTGYSKTDASGTTTYYDLQGAKTGSVYSYTNWDGTKSLSHYDANGNYIGWSSTDAQGKVLNSTMYNYTGGVYTGYTTFDGITTTVYDASGMFVSSTVDVTKLTLNTAQDGYFLTDAYGTTTYYNLQGAKTGSSYTYTYSDGTKSISHYDANGSYIGWSNTDAQGKVLSSNMYNYDGQGNYIGYTYFDGVTTTVYDSFGYVISATANTANMTPLDANGNVLVDANHDGFDDVNTSVAVASYKYTDTYGTTSYFDLSGAKTGYSYTYTNWDGTKSISHYNASGSYIGWSNTDAQGNVLSSSMYNYDAQGNYIGYTYFDGVTTTVYDSFGYVISATANTANMTPLDANGNVLVDANHDGFDDVNTNVAVASYRFTDAYGTTSYFDLTGAKTGYSYTYTNWDGTKSISHYNASGSYIGWSNTDAQGNVLSSSMYNYDAQGNYIGYTYFDGITTTVYGSNGNVISTTASTANMTPLDANGNVLIDADRNGFDDTTNVAVASYKFTDSYGTTTTYDLQGVKTGSSYTYYDSWNNTTTVSTYKADGTFLKSVTTDANGTVVYSMEYLYNTDGSYAGYTRFDGTNTYTYDANGNLTSDAPPEVTSLVFNADGATINFSENTFAPANPADLAMNLMKNGVTPMTITAIDGGGTTSLTIHTDQAMATGDWILVNYGGTSAANGFVDAVGNVMTGGANMPGYGGSAEGSSANDVIDLSNATVFAASAYDIMGGSGNDTLTGSAGSDWIEGGAGADTLTGGAAMDVFAFGQDGTSGPVAAFNGSWAAGMLNGNTFTFSGAGADVVTDFSTGDGVMMSVSLSNQSSMQNGLSMLAGAPTDILGLDQGWYLVQGNYSAGTFTVNTTAGTDTMVVYDGDAGIGSVGLSGVVLRGVTVSQLGAYTGSSYISYMGGGVTPPPTGDTMSPVAMDAWSNGIGAFGLAFNEAVQLNMTGGNALTAYVNGVTPMTLTGAYVDTAFPNEIAASYSNTLTATDYIVATYQADGTVTDLAGNWASSGTMVIAGTGGSTIDLQATPLPMGTIYPIYIRGQQGNDVIVGTDNNDLIKTGRGADVIEAGFGADNIDLSESALSSDTVVVGMWDSQRGQADTVFGFDTSSVDANLHDVLGLSSNVIAADVAKTNGQYVFWTDSTNANQGVTAHSISVGVATFYDINGLAMTVNAANRGYVNDYLALNLSGLGETVAYQGDTNGDGQADTLHVYQNNSTAMSQNAPTVIHLNGVVGATLGTTAGANVVQIADLVGPEVTAAWVAGANSISFEYSENVTVDQLATHNGIFLNGVGTDIVNGFSVNGNVVTMSTAVAIGATDWMLMTSAADILDAAGNRSLPGMTAALGADGDNTIDLSAGVANSTSIYIDGFGGNDTLTGSSGSEDIRGGEGSDIIAGNGGQDYIWLDETTAASDTVVINVGDSTPAGGASDLVYNFNVTSGSLNDVLDLPSNVIAADTVGAVAGIQSGAIMSHSISNGMISFYGSGGMPGMPGMPVVVNDMTNWFDVKNYMVSNIADGQTVATYIDMNGNGSYADVGDRLAVFQGNATTDIQVQLYDTMDMVTALSNTAQLNAVTII